MKLTIENGVTRTLQVIFGFCSFVASGDIIVAAALSLFLSVIVSMVESIE